MGPPQPVLPVQSWFGATSPQEKEANSTAAILPGSPCKPPVREIGPLGRLAPMWCVPWGRWQPNCCLTRRAHHAPCHVCHALCRVPCRHRVSASACAAMQVVDSERLGAEAALMAHGLPAVYGSAPLSTPLLGGVPHVLFVYFIVCL